MDSDALTIVEWADKVAPALPEDCVQIDIAVTGPTSRQFTIRGVPELPLP